MALRLNSEIELKALIHRMKHRDEQEISQTVPKQSKYHSVITEAMGIKFHSKKEARYYLELVCRQKAGEIIYFLTQVPLRLPGNTKYVVDFVEFHKDGSVRYVDVKGCVTPMFTMKRKQVEAIYPIRIEVV